MDYVVFVLWYVAPEHWMIHGGPGFSRRRMIWLLPHPPPSPSPVSKIDHRQTGRLRRRDNLLTWEGGGGEWGAKSNDGEETWFSINHLKLSGPTQCLSELIHSTWGYTTRTHKKMTTEELTPGILVPPHFFLRESQRRYNTYVEGNPLLGFLQKRPTIHSIPRHSCAFLLSLSSFLSMQKMMLNP